MDLSKVIHTVVLGFAIGAAGFFAFVAFESNAALDAVMDQTRECLEIAHAFSAATDECRTSLDSCLAVVHECTTQSTPEFRP